MVTAQVRQLPHITCYHGRNGSGDRIRYDYLLQSPGGNGSCDRIRRFICYTGSMKVHRSHPQVYESTEVRTVTVFDCYCGKTFHIHSAYVEPDGTLTCYSCRESTKLLSKHRGRCPECRTGVVCSEYNKLESSAPDLRWCSRCKTAKNRDEFKQNSYTSQVSPQCIECIESDKAAKTVSERVCENCDREFLPTRKDARYCSGRCRVAAYRAHRSDS